MWSLYQENQKLNPLKFSNGKTQESVVKEVLDAIEEGNKVIFIQGKCGTGKSVLALHIAKELGKASIVVPGKSLQAQYKRDYENNKYILKKNNQKLKISIITGRNNHECLFLKKTEDFIPRRSFEINSKLNDIFSVEPALKK
ncbi:MAG TPA: DEAD/DEAH box helicase family protein [Candidatus Pacearchaeota archaeon]|nr:DEAD/DEAH box helicase family protein [Candidatus Pacearchaeota archaeon]